MYIGAIPCVSFNRFRRWVSRQATSLCSPLCWTWCRRHETSPQQSRLAPRTHPIGWLELSDLQPFSGQAFAEVTGGKGENGIPNDSQPCCSQCCYKVEIADIWAVTFACDKEAHYKNVSVWLDVIYCSIRLDHLGMIRFNNSSQRDWKWYAM